MSHGIGQQNHANKKAATLIAQAYDRESSEQL